MSLIKFEFTFDTTSGEFSVVNTDTGEVKTAKAVKETKKKPKKEESTTPQLILEDNKYRLNTAAIELIGVQAGDRLDIKYEQKDKAYRPIIGSDEVFGTHNGNLLSKSNTVTCKGAKREELVKYGNIFTVLAHESSEGLFVLVGDKEVPIKKELKGDDNIKLEEDDDLSLEGLIDSEDEKSVEIDPDFFVL